MNERRGLLERLQHPVGRLIAEPVDPLNHEHPPAGLERRLAGGGDDGLVDVGDQHLVGAARNDPRQIRMRSGPHSLLGARPVPPAAGQELGGEGSGGRALAGPTRPVEEVRVRGHRGVVQHRTQHRPGMRVAVEFGEHRLRC